MFHGYPQLFGNICLSHAARGTKSLHDLRYTNRHSNKFITIKWSVLRQAHIIFQRLFSREFHLVLPLSSKIIFTFLLGNSVAAHVFFLVLSFILFFFQWRILEGSSYARQTNPASLIRSIFYRIFLPPWLFVMEFTAFYGTQSVITATTRSCHLSLSWARSIQSMPHPTSWRSIVILSFYPRVCLPSGLLPSDFSTKTL